MPAAPVKTQGAGGKRGAPAPKTSLPPSKAATHVASHGRSQAADHVASKPIITGSSNALAIAASIQAKAVVKDVDKAKASRSATGEHYEGGLDAQGRRHGKGVLTWANGNQYDGDWVAGRMTGRALFTYGGQGGDAYEGMFLNDKKHGDGQYVFANGNTYVGKFENDKRHGTGEYHWVCGDKYIGEWSEGKMHGHGVTTYANGNQYIGQFKEDRRDGRGKLVCTDGLTFDGEWKNNMRNGHGTLTFPNGDAYSGGWLDDQKHGKGIDTFVNGNRFEGMYDHNQKCGFGKMTFANGDVYEGEWYQDTMHGKGTYRFNNGYMYEGSWQNDLRHGYGVYKFNNTVYQGEWYEDRRHGKGVMTVDNGAEVYRGCWQAGKMEGRFEVTITKPVVVGYIGEWKGGQPLGTGTFTFESGAHFEGQWDMQQVKPKARNEVLNIIAEIPGEPAEPQVAVKKIADDANDRRLNELQLVVEKLQREKSDLMRQMTSMQESQQTALQDQQQVTALQRALAAVREELAASQMKEKRSEQSIAAAKEEAEKWKKEAESLATQLKGVRSAAETLKSQAEAREKLLNDMQRKLDSAVHGEVGQKAVMETQVETLHQECTQLKSRLSTAEKELTECRAALVNETSKVVDLRHQLTAMTTVNALKNDQLLNLQRSLDVAQQERAAISVDLSACKKELQQAWLQNTQAEKSWAAVNVKTSQAAAEKDQQIEALRQQLTDRQQEILALQGDKRSLEEKLAALQSQQLESLQLQQQTPTQDNTVQELQTQIAELQQREIEQQHNISVLQTQVDELHKEAHNLHQHIGQLQQELQAATHSKTEEKESQSHLMQGIAERDHKISELELQISAMSRANTALTEEVHEAQRWARKMKEDAALVQEMNRKLEVSLTTQKSEMDHLQQRYEQAMHEVEALRAAAACRNTRPTTQEAILRSQVAELRSQLQDMEQDGRHNAQYVAMQMGILDELREAKKDAEADLRVARQEMASLAEQLAQEKKRRKRAEKLMGSECDISAESYKAQVVLLKSELEKSKAMVASLQCQLDTRDEKAAYRHQKSENKGPHDADDAVYDKQMQELIHKMEEKDKLLQYQAEEIRKMTQLEAQLQIARDKLEVMTASSEISEMKEMTRLLSAQAQMETRYLMSLPPAERVAQLSRDFLQRSTSDQSRFPQRGSDGTSKVSVAPKLRTPPLTNSHHP